MIVSVLFEKEDLMIYRRYSVPSAWEEMERVQREMNKLMSGFPLDRPRSASVFPAMNAWTTDEEEVVTAALPGLTSEEVELTIVNDVLTVSGERKSQAPEEEITYHRRERADGKFSRSIQLSFPVDSNKVSAAFENGILTVRLPRAEADKPRKISVKTL
jgi:HSP20 family protein